MKSNLFKDIPDNMPDELLQTITERSNIKIERIVSRGHSNPDDFWYDQQWDEWVLLVQGRAALAFEGDVAVMELEPGDHLLIPAHKRHRVAWTQENEDTIWLAVHIYPQTK